MVNWPISLVMYIMATKSCHLPQICTTGQSRISLTLTLEACILVWDAWIFLLTMLSLLFFLTAAVFFYDNIFCLLMILGSSSEDLSELKLFLSAFPTFVKFLLLEVTSFEESFNPFSAFLTLEESLVLIRVKNAINIRELTISSTIKNLQCYFINII